DEDNSFDLDNDESKTNFNDLLIAEFINLNFYNNNEIENNLPLNNQQQLETEEYLDYNLDLEVLFNKEFQN
ncbi:27250_t:CDS:1, partial [Dentiscutata erythropus]